MELRPGIPPNWKLVKLKDVSSIVTDGTHKTPKYVENGIRFISIANIRPFQPINWSNYEKFITIEEHQELVKRARPERDDILFPRIGTLGFAKRIDFNEEVSIFVGLGLVKPLKEVILPKFLEFYMNSPFVNQFSQQNATGTGRLTLPLEASRSMPVPIPPLPQQHRIIAKIEELFSELDKGIESIKAAQQQLKVYRQAIYKYALEGNFTEGNYSWETLKIQDLCQTIDGDRGPNYPKKEDYGERGYCLFLSTKNVRPYGFEFLNNIFIDEKKHNELRNGTLQRGDLVITTRGTLGNVAIYDDSVPYEVIRINSGMLILRLKSQKIMRRFLMHCLMSPLFFTQIRKKQSGTAQPQIPANILKEFTIQLPPRDIQEKIIQEIESRLSVCDKIEETISQSLNKAESLRQSILKKAFEGRLLPQDPTDEPADKLLERIRTEQANQKPEKKPSQRRTKK